MFAQEILRTKCLWDYGIKFLWDYQIGQAVRDDLERTHFLNVRWDPEVQRQKSLASGHRLDLELHRGLRGWTSEKEEALAGTMEWLCGWTGRRSPGAVVQCIDLVPSRVIWWDGGG